MDSVLQLMQRRPERASPAQIGTLREQVARIHRTVRQMTAQREYGDLMLQFQALAATDSLTGLHNRRNFFRLAGYRNLSMSIAKMTRIREGHQLELRLEIQNVPNAVHYDEPGSNRYSNGDFGVVDPLTVGPG